MENQHGARNPKEARLSVNVSQDINGRVERIADLYQFNKGTAAAFLIAVGLRAVEETLVDAKVEGIQIPQK